MERIAKMGYWTGETVLAEMRRLPVDGGFLKNRRGGYDGYFTKISAYSPR